MLSVIIPYLSVDHKRFEYRKHGISQPSVKPGKTLGLMRPKNRSSVFRHAAGRASSVTLELANYMTVWMY